MGEQHWTLPFEGKEWRALNIVAAAASQAATASNMAAATAPCTISAQDIELLGYAFVSTKVYQESSLL